MQSRGGGPSNSQDLPTKLDLEDEKKLARCKAIFNERYPSEKIGERDAADPRWEANKNDKYEGAEENLAWG